MSSPPSLVTTVAGMRSLVACAVTAGRSIGLVPTMGALHDGHAALIRQARSRDGFVAVSIFVNPLQFDRQDDLDHYPRTLDADQALCASLGVDAVFAPAAAEMYPAPPEVRVEVGRLADHLCGASRPGHFAGVATVVLKLLQIVQPTRAYFGEKDAQQLAIIRTLVADLNVPVEIVGMPTVRAADGLALSSRNTRLSPGGRQRAVALVRALTGVREAIGRGDTDARRLRDAAAATIPADDGLALDYLDIVDPRTLQPVAVVTGPVLVAGALWVDGVRLIDNVTASPGGGGPAGAGSL